MSAEPCMVMKKLLSEQVREDMLGWGWMSMIRQFLLLMKLLCMNEFIYFVQWSHLQLSNHWYWVVYIKSVSAVIKVSFDRSVMPCICLIYLLITSWMTAAMKGSMMTIIHLLHCTEVQVSLASKSLSLSLYCLSSEECMCCWPVLVSSLFCRQVKAEACQYPAASLLLVFGAHRTIPSVCCTCQGGMWEMRGWREEEERSEPPPPLSLMLSGPKNRPHPPFFSIPNASLFPYTGRLPVSLSVFPIFSLFLLISLFGLSKHGIWCRW